MSSLYFSLSPFIFYLKFHYLLQQASFVFIHTLTVSQLKRGTLKKGRITAVAGTEAAKKSCASLSLIVGANCSVQTGLHLHTDTATGVAACIRE
jgi:hypothetical protein